MELESRTCPNRVKLMVVPSDTTRPGRVRRRSRASCYDFVARSSQKRKDDAFDSLGRAANPDNPDASQRRTIAPIEAPSARFALGRWGLGGWGASRRGKTCSTDALTGRLRWRWVFNSLLGRCKSISIQSAKAVAEAFDAFSCSRNMRIAWAVVEAAPRRPRVCRQIGLPVGRFRPGPLMLCRSGSS